MYIVDKTAIVFHLACHCMGLLQHIFHTKCLNYIFVLYSVQDTVWTQNININAGPPFITFFFITSEKKNLYLDLYVTFSKILYFS